MIFGFQADNITDKFLHVGLIAIPILIQVYFNASLTYGLMRLFGVRTPWPRQERLSEQAIFGSGSGAVLATVVGQGEWPSRQTSPDPHRKLLQFFP